MDMTISQVSRTYCVSTRTLRYYESIGLLCSSRRPGYAYRVYDEAAVQRLERILFLRGLRLPLRSIALLLDGDEKAAELLRTRAEELEREISLLDTARQSLLHLAGALDAGELAALSHKKEEVCMPEIPQLTDVRLLMLPRMTVAAAHCMGEHPEDAADAQLRAFVQQSGLADRKPDARVFGFNHPSPAPGRTEYGYELWVTIPSEMEVPAPLVKKEMPGGLYAAHAIAMGDFHEWAWLAAWAEHSPDYQPCDASEEDNMGGCLEEHLNYLLAWPEEQSARQLDLLLPVCPRT